MTDSKRHSEQFAKVREALAAHASALNSGEGQTETLMAVWTEAWADLDDIEEQLEALERAVEFAAEKIEQGDYGAALSRLTASTRIRTPTPWDEREFARNAEAVRRATESTPAKEQA